ncbi:MAG: bifunctional hydroxymethylpyrimidine kinase/phosphomethylpyrimidine kinase [Planctomycetota bacterium]
MSGAWVLAMGGVDPSGGAGLDADRAAIEAAGARAETVMTAWTDQDDRAVRAVRAVDRHEWVFAALERCALANPGALKFGLLPPGEGFEGARTLWHQLHFESPELPAVWDPVIASSSGYRFVPDADLPAMRELLHLPWIVTPNLPEAAQLLGAGEEWRDWQDAALLEAARTLLEAGPLAVVLKHGHGQGEQVRDLAGHAAGSRAGSSARGSVGRLARACAAPVAASRAAWPPAWPSARIWRPPPAGRGTRWPPSSPPARAEPGPRVSAPRAGFLAGRPCVPRSVRYASGPQSGRL